jgi:DNA replication protein DnaC
MTIHTQPTALDSIKKSLVALKMPRALEMLDTALRRVEQGDITWVDALDHLLLEELTLRDNRRVSTALRMSRLTTVKTLAGFDFTFQPSLDRNRILALAELKFIDRAEVVHLLGPPSTGKSHLATALAVEAVKAGKSVAFATLAEIVTSLAKAEREGTLRERLRFLARASLLVVDEIGYLPVVAGGGNLFFQLVNARYEKGAMILTSNRGFAEWGEVFGDPVVATALLDRLLHHAVVIQIEGSSYRLRQHAALLPENVRTRSLAAQPPQPKRRGRPTERQITIPTTADPRTTAAAT